ncbi:phenylacetate--CoA ligase family protein [Chloroflexota bacterium]
MDEERTAVYARRIAAYKPKYLRGYPSALSVLAAYLQKEGMNTITPEAIFTTAEMLLPQHREMIEKQFGCRVFDNYGCYDGGPQAMECSQHSGYHISVEKAILEFVDEDKRQVPPGCSGEILTTDLYNYTMPFIRYAVGDKGTLSARQCPCGCGLPLMESIEGRITDLIVFGNGVILSGPALTLAFKDCRIKQYQVIQEAKDELLIKIIKAEGYSDEDTQHFLGIIRAHIGENIDINVRFVNEISTTKSGKRRFIISNVPQ